MLLSIDQRKINEQMAGVTRQYTVTACNLEPEAVPSMEPDPIRVCGTVAGLPADVERARARLVALRQRIIDSGHQPLPADELDRYIDDTRGR